MNQLAEFYKSLPHYDEYIQIYPDIPSLKYALRDLYNDYVDFSLLTIRYLRSSPLSELLIPILHSRPCILTAF